MSSCGDEGPSPCPGFLAVLRGLHSVCTVLLGIKFKVLCSGCDLSYSSRREFYQALQLNFLIFTVLIFPITKSRRVSFLLLRVSRNAISFTLPLGLQSLKYLFPGILQSTLLLPVLSILEASSE